MNEYLPVGPVITQISASAVSNIYTFHKFDPNLPWGEYEIEVKNEWSNPYGNYPYANNKSNFNIQLGQNKYGAVASSDNYVDAGDEEDREESMEAGNTST